MRELRSFLKIIISSAKVQISQTFSRPMFKYIVLVQPLFYSFMLSLIYSNASKSDFINYVVIGTGMISLWSSVMYSSASDIDREKYIGTMVYLFSSPTKFSTILIGKIIGNTLLGVLPVIINTLLLINIFDLTIEISSYSFLVLILFLSLITFISMAFFLCLSFTLSRQIRVFMNFFIYPIYILCGATFSIDILPEKLKLISYLLPPTWLIKIIREFILQEINYDYIINLIVLLLIYNLLSYKFLNKFYDNIKLNATLEVF